MTAYKRYSGNNVEIYDKEGEDGILIRESWGNSTTMYCIQREVGGYSKIVDIVDDTTMVIKEYTIFAGYVGEDYSYYEEGILKQSKHTPLKNFPSFIYRRDKS